ncbi:MAG TPA: thioredoxin domain-containing protein [Acetobacteraceae bacterium]|nr:thioredoxin domain-containing protein [Acetobacteraceae bacterium]
MLPQANLLRHEKSPYLLQHAENPVHWRAWRPEALAEARETGKPILLSVGYAACHWCHVMAHESFEDPETAALMNRLFVNIKVDREERPDIDHIYMSALHALGEQGGWPLTMFLSPEGHAFWGGTYFPPEPRWGRPSFRQVLQAVAKAWADDASGLDKNTKVLQRHLADMARTQPGAGLTPADLDQVGEALLGLTDPVNGGLRGAPKFPNPPIFRFLWQEAHRTDRAAFARPVLLLLRRMSQGGIYDHLGGGYARYATDAHWLVPHFEKMLYDNAEILDLLALAHAAAPSPLFALRAEETVGWLTRDMSVGAAFAASEDADSEGEEGRFYVWTEAEIDTLLGPAAPAFKAAYDVRPGGNWEGKTIFQRVTRPGNAAEEADLARSRGILFEARTRRVRPGRDDKVLADWNALTIAALCRAANVFRQPSWLARAGAAYDALLALLGQADGRVAHAARDGQVTAPGLLEDQAAMGHAALALFEATGDAARLAQAIAHAESALAWFADDDGSFFMTARDAADIPAARPRRAGDDVTPSGNGLMAVLFARLFHLTGATSWRARAEAVLRAFSGAGRGLASMPTLLAAADTLENATTVVIVGDRAGAEVGSLAAAALATSDPAVCVLRATRTENLDPDHPAHGKSVPSGAQAAAYVCRGGTCGLPVTTVDALDSLLRHTPA